MAKKQKKFKKISKAPHKLNWKRPKFVLLALFAFSFAGVGIYMLAFSSAGTLPVSFSAYHENKVLGLRLASDGVKGNVFCASTVGQTAYGPLANCYQHKPNTKHPKMLFRVGFYSPITDRFNPNTDWLVSAGTGLNEGKATLKCNNIPYLFKSAHSGADGNLKTIYGPIKYGQVYRQVGNGYELKWANISTHNFNCSTEGSWLKANKW